MAAANDDINGLQQEILTASLMLRLIDYGEKYEISVQLWPQYKTIYVAKDGVDLFSYGDHDLQRVLSRILEYLDRINAKKPAKDG